MNKRINLTTIHWIVGLGSLGLASGTQNIEHMGGQIGFDSLEGQGSTFCFDLPIRAATTQEASL